MKNHFRLLTILIVMILIAGTISASAASISGMAAQQPWVAQLFLDGEGGVLNMSSAFVGPNQVPMFSYNKTASHHIYQVHAATSVVPGNCGPNNAWYCDSWQDSDLVPGSVSQMSTNQYPDTHSIKWVYSTGTMLRGVWLELMNDMTFVDADWLDLVQIGKFGSTLVGTPSLYADSGGHFELAFTVLGSGDLYPYSLVYMTYVGGSHTSCSSVASGYECVVIDISFGYNSMSTPSLAVVDDTPRTGIAYYKNGVVKYAYPHTPSPGWPSNCGPGGNTWRCISIFSGSPTGTVGRVVKLAMGESMFDRGIAFTYDDELIPVTLYHANFVGSAGNCGYDLGPGGGGSNEWQCDDLIGYDYLSAGGTPSFSIDIDPENYSVIAYDYRMDDLGNNDLYLVYPIARTGNPGTGWTVQHIDGASVFDVETGAQAALALSDTGMGFISYLQEEDYEPDDLKIAFQLYQVILPIVSKP